MCCHPVKRRTGYGNEKTHDSSRRLTAACDDIRAVRSMMFTVGDQEEYANAYDALKVIGRAPESIIGEMQDALINKERSIIRYKAGFSQ